MTKRKCKECKEYFTAGIKVPAGFFCTHEHAVKFAVAKAEAARERARSKSRKAVEDKKKAERQQHKKDKQRIKTLSQLKAEAQTAFNAYIRERDRGQPCISCGRSEQEIEADQGWKHGGCWDAGHFMSRGAKPQLRYNLLNVWRQCKKCNGGEVNKHHSALVSEKYEKNLVKKIGRERADNLKNNNEIARFERDYLVRLKEAFRKRLRILRKIRKADTLA